MAIPPEKKDSPIELLKQSSPALTGTISATLANADTERFSEDDYNFLKFHGIYQQDDRDVRKSGKKYMFMVRLRLPGGVISPAQYRACDELSARYGNNTLRVTSRQSLQFHGVLKSGLGPLMKGINEALITSLAACGDVNRNVMAPPTPPSNEVGILVNQHAREVAAALSPRTRAYHSIWVEGVELNLQEAKDFVDPLYGKGYLPRKFKIGFAIPPLNDVDIFADCCGFIAIADSRGQLLGYNLTAGGGMGRSHGNEQTFPRVADVMGFLPPEKVVDVARAALTIHRDFGDRSNRKHARLKYILADRGAKWFRQELEQRLGLELQAAKPFEFVSQGDAFGWHRQSDGRLFLGLFVETGRIKDTERCRMKAGLREVIAKFKPEIRLTPGNNVLLVNISPEQQEEITKALAAHGIQTESARQGTVLRRASMACVALPTCGLALAESERFLPGLITQMEKLLAKLGLTEQEITIRVTGCPNGCARPYLAEIGLVGKAPGKYQVYLGGSAIGTRLNRLYKDTVRDADLVDELRPILLRFKAERAGEERFGDWVQRVLWQENKGQELNFANSKR